MFYQHFDRPWCTMVSIDFVSASRQIKLYDYVEQYTFLHGEFHFSHEKSLPFIQICERNATGKPSNPSNPVKWLQVLHHIVPSIRSRRDEFP